MKAGWLTVDRDDVVVAVNKSCHWLVLLIDSDDDRATAPLFGV